MGALWKGTGATVVGVMPARASTFRHMQRRSGCKRTISMGATNIAHSSELAVVAGVLTSTATNPIWLVKTKMQLQQGRAATVGHYSSSLDCVRTVVRQEGVAALSRPDGVLFGGPRGTIQWVIYERLKWPWEPPTRWSTDLAGLLGTAATAKLIAAVASYPHEVLRTRLREHNSPYKGLLRTACASCAKRAWWPSMAA